MALADYLCAICRNYARGDDPIATQNTTIRVTQEDLDAHPDLQPRPRPGALRCCRDCFAVWAPVVVERWKAEGIVGPAVPWQALGTNLV